MKNRVVYILVFIFLPFFVFSQDDGARGSISKKIDKSKVIGEKRALVVGVSEYQSEDLNLKYADDDAFLFKQYLTKVDSVPEKNIAYLVNKEATSFNILSALNNLIETSNEGDIV
ncbi:MAG: caspase family protein, partial [Bacteroidia bacterium]|nr:caspase family protein [Bacteroidia bacterium]